MTFFRFLSIWSTTLKYLKGITQIEQPVYGRSRVGLFRRSIQPEGQAEESQPQAGELGQYELSNHLGADA
ncbi:hypothetical protein AAG747_21000 [Rapidithrix thailandica]|uniref:Uncharacterized protein n=1 Tax=Rapidithrix thailandica TaxID=413964 RepID=A0AAW9SD23_9BACT